MRILSVADYLIRRIVFAPVYAGKKEKTLFSLLCSDVNKEVNQEKGHKDQCPDELVP